MDEKYYGRIDLTTEVLVKAGRLVAQLEVITDLEDKVLFLAAELQDYGEAVKGRALAEVGVKPPVDGFVSGLRVTIQSDEPQADEPLAPCQSCGKVHYRGDPCHGSGIPF